MLAAGVFHGVEGRDRTADTGHAEGEKHADRVRRRAHDVIDQIVGSEGHGQLRSEVTIAEVARVSLLERKLSVASLVARPEQAPRPSRRPLRGLLRMRLTGYCARRNCGYALR